MFATKIIAQSFFPHAQQQICRLPPFIIITMAVNRSVYLLLIAALCCVFKVNAFQTSFNTNPNRSLTKVAAQLNDSSSMHDLSSRRVMLRSMLQGMTAFSSAALIVGNPNSSRAAAVASLADLKKLQLGHSRVQVSQTVYTFVNNYYFHPVILTSFTTKT